MSTATVRTGIDSWTSSAAASTNYGGGKWLRMQAGGTVKNAYLYQKPAVPRGATVLSALLHVYSVGVQPSITVNLQRISARWSESQLNYNNAPGVTGSVVAVTQASAADATEWIFDVTALLQTYANGAAFYGFRLSTTNTTEREFYSLNATDHRPILVVQWSDAPDAPTELSPAGGSAVTLSKPKLTFNFHDVSGSTAMQACNVQINPTNVFTSPAFDSGTVLTSDPELDLAATAYAGISLGATAWWRVRVQDAAGIWSDWSSARNFTRVARGTLSIGSPTGGVVNDATQTVIWSLTGATQTAWRIIVADDADPTNHLLDTGRRSGTAVSYTIPKGIITSETTTYRLRVLVWDEPLRVQTPGDPVQTEAVTTFVFVEDPTPNPVTSLVAAQVASGRPRVALTWSRSTAPDYFSIWRNGRLVDTDLVPADLYTSGTSYQFVDATAEPHTAHTWKVRCKVSGKLGPGPSTGLVYEVDAVWLTDIDTGKLVPVLVDTEARFDMPEIAAVFRPVNGSSVVRISQGHYGLEGHVEGIVEGYADGTAASWVANLLWMKARPENTLRLTVGGENLHAIIGNVVIAPAPDGGPDDRAVSFDFWSQDGVVQQ